MMAVSPEAVRAARGVEGGDVDRALDAVGGAVQPAVPSPINPHQDLD